MTCKYLSFNLINQWVAVCVTDPIIFVTVVSDLPRERENLFSKFPEQGILGVVGEHQNNIDVAWPQFDQITGVGNVSQFCHFHKVLFGRTTASIQGEKDRKKETDQHSVNRQRKENTCSVVV